MAGFTLISKVVTAGSQTTVTFSSIPQTYSALYVTFYGRHAEAGQQQDSILCRYNNDSGNNYNYHQWISFGSSTNAASQFTAVNQLQVFFSPGATASAIYAGVGDLLIPNYTGTVYDKASLAETTEQSGAAASGRLKWTPDYIPATPVAITRLDFYPSGGAAFVNGSILCLYGLPT